MVCIFLLVWLVINNFDWQFFLVCGGKEYKMEFSVEVFRQKPSYDILGLCRKNDLYLIADFYQVKSSQVELYCHSTTCVDI